VWQIENLTPFEAAGNWTRDRDGAEVWLVAVRCTFEIHPDGTTTIAKTQVPPVLAPVFTADAAASSMKYDSDFHLTKPTSDVLLHGHAYAPHGRPASVVDVTLRVGEMAKTLRVTGDRTYEKGLLGATTTSPEPFLRMPITYERTHGGREPDPPAVPDRPNFDVRNPVGSGFAAAPGTMVPNVSYPGRLSGTPAGFGPIPAHWRPRVTYAGTYDDVWRKTRLPLYPHDLDDRFFLCSPEDQRPRSFLRGGELLELVNLTPNGAMLFRLPSVAFRFETHFRGKPSVTHRAALHTVILEPDDRRVVMVWQTALRAHADVHRLEETLITQLQVLNPRDGAVPASASLEDA
jgi:hypothetical protein